MPRNKLVYRGLWMDSNGHQFIYEACAEAVRLARELDQEIAFRFMGVLVIATPKSQAADLVIAYNHAVKALDSRP